VLTAADFPALIAALEAIRQLIISPDTVALTEFELGPPPGNYPGWWLAHGRAEEALRLLSDQGCTSVMAELDPCIPPRTRAMIGDLRRELRGDGPRFAGWFRHSDVPPEMRDGLLIFFAGCIRDLGTLAAPDPGAPGLPAGYTGQELVSAAQLAELTGVKKNTLEKRLQRFREDNRRAFEMPEDGGGRNPTYLYYIGQVWPTVSRG
jgi:hypothetical protein